MYFSASETRSLSPFVRVGSVGCSAVPGRLSRFAKQVSPSMAASAAKKAHEKLDEQLLAAAKAGDVRK